MNQVIRSIVSFSNILNMVETGMQKWEAVTHVHIPELEVFVGNYFGCNYFALAVAEFSKSKLLHINKLHIIKQIVHVIHTVRADILHMHSTTFKASFLRSF